jgi:hypothetical protein
MSRLDDELRAEWDAWFARMSPTERDKVVAMGLGSGHKPNDLHANTSPDMERWLGASDPPTTKESNLPAADIARILLSIYERPNPSLDILCILLEVDHPAANLEESVVHTGITRRSLMRRGERVIEETTLNRMDYHVLELLAFIACRPKPRMTLLCALRACGEVGGGVMTLEQIAAENHVTKQNVHREVSIIKHHFALGKTRYDRSEDLRRVYREHFVPQRTRISDITND